MKDSAFASALASELRDYITAKRALAPKFHNEQAGLRLLDRFLAARQVVGVADVTPALVEEFVVSRHRVPARSHNHLLGVVRRFFEWLVSQGRLAVSPVHMRPRRETASSLPYLFRPEEVRALLDAAARLPDTWFSPARGRTYRMAFALLYALGLRVGEVSRLRVGDVDLDRDLLVIRGTKFGKSRLVPFGPRLGAELRGHLELRGSAARDADAFLLLLAMTEKRGASMASRAA